MRLIWANTAFRGEALCLWAGHLEIAHWLHGTSLPPFPTYFSGAPVIYPPLGALADSIGGLAGARLLSLGFMLTATSALWATAARLYGRRAAFFSCGLWAVLGPTIRLGSYATYDAMSVCLIALAAWSVIKAGAQKDGTRWMLAAAGILISANVTNYASVIFDPVIVALAVLAACPKPGGKAAKARGALVFTYIAAAFVLLMKVSGHAYVSGFDSTTLAHATSDASAVRVLVLSWDWTGVVVAAAGCGVILSLVGTRQWYRTLIMSALLGAALLAPAEQAHIHTITSLNNQVDFGAWFAAIASGYAADRAALLSRHHVVKVATWGACSLALIHSASLGMAQAQAFFSGPSAVALVTALRPLADAETGHILVENSSIPEYYLAAGHDWGRWSNTFSITLPSGHTVGYSTASLANPGRPAAYRHYITSGYFSLVALNPRSGVLERDLTMWLRHNPDYRMIAKVPYGRSDYVIWKRVSVNASIG